MSTADAFAVVHAKATNDAIHLLASALGATITGLPEPERTYTRAASLDDLHAHHRAVQDAFDKITEWMQQMAAAVAEVVARPAIEIVVPVPEVNIAAALAVPETPAVVTFNRDRDGRIVSAEKVPVP